MRPVLKPGLRRLWRNSTTLQIGVDPARAVILTGLRPAHLCALDALEHPGPVLHDGQAHSPATRTMIDLLAQAGLLDDGTETDQAPRAGRSGRNGHTSQNPRTSRNTGTGENGQTSRSPEADEDAEADDMAFGELDQKRLAPDVAALSLSSFGVRLPRSAMLRRRRARVALRGAGRIGAQIATLLAAAGVGQVIVDDPGPTSAADLAPGGLRLDDVGRPRSLATQAALDRVGGRRDPPAASSGGPAGRASRSGQPEPLRPDLLLLAPVGIPLIHPDECLGLERSGVPHLLAGVRETTGVVGPLVVPAVTACLHCQHLHRDACDPDWPILAMQMIRPPGHGADPCEISLATLVAAIACMQALDYLDAFPPTTAGPKPRLPPTAGGTLEISRADLRLRRRSWPPHPECPCRTSRTAATMSPDADISSPASSQWSTEGQRITTGSAS